MAAFGKDIMEKEFLMDYHLTFVNQASNGTCPRKVFDSRLDYIHDMESNPDNWVRWKNDSYWQEAVEGTAEFLRANAENMVLVNNEITGINSVLRSYNFSKGDGILLSSWTYYSVRNTADYVAREHELEVYQVNLGSKIESIQQIIAAYEAMLQAHTNIKMVVIDHISSRPSVLMPVAGLLTLCRLYNKLVLIDGTHAPGQLDLNLDEINADYYVGSLYKWAYAPRGSSFLWINPMHKNTIFPVVTSFLDISNMQVNYRWLGTGDVLTQYITTLNSIRFYREIGGFPAISEYCSDLATRAANLLVERWSTKHFEIPDSMRAPFLRTVLMPDLQRFPTAKGNIPLKQAYDADELRDEIWTRFKIMAYFFSYDNQLWCRISVNVYNELQDYEKLASAILELVQEEKSSSCSIM